MDKIYKSAADIEKDFFPELYKERCTDCGHRAQKADAYCHECGTLLDPERPGVVAMVMLDHCRRCGHPNNLGNKCCTQCGNKMAR